MFRPMQPASGVQIVVVQECAAHCNAVFLSSCYSWLCGLQWLLLILFDLLIATALNVLVGASSAVCGSAITVRNTVLNYYNL
jgi:hypothetical protein